MKPLAPVISTVPKGTSWLAESPIRGAFLRPRLRMASEDRPSAFVPDGRNAVLQGATSITRVKLSPSGEAEAYAPFVTGGLNEDTGRARGRPVDVLQMPDGALPVSDDAGGRIWRVSYAR